MTTYSLARWAWGLVGKLRVAASLGRTAEVDATITYRSYLLRQSAEATLEPRKARSSYPSRANTHF